ncbi:MAG: DNA-binding transcriptional regulator [Gammaproteobacteria bacterium]|nr:DNA-binding transcriptional regulator [Gammaproteobacteria bacterium]
MKEHRVLTPREEAVAEDRLFRAILTARNVEECRAFFHDLCTPAELQALKDRWAVAELLAEGRLSYREVHEHTGVSVTTIGRVARYIGAGEGGYRKALQRIHRQDENRKP